MKKKSRLKLGRESLRMLTTLSSVHGGQQYTTWATCDSERLTECLSCTCAEVR